MEGVSYMRGGNGINILDHGQKSIFFYSPIVLFGLFCVLLGQSADGCPIFLLLVIETDKFLKPNTQLAHFWETLREMRKTGI